LNRPADEKMDVPAVEEFLIKWIEEKEVCEEILEKVRLGKRVEEKPRRLKVETEVEKI
jgi:hypothetical protein